MAVQSIAVPPDPRRDARAAELVPSVSTWPRFVLKQAWGSFEPGTTFRRASGSNGAHYLVNSVACQCPDYQERGFICKHIRAHVRWERRQAAPQPQPKVRYEDLMPTCQAPGCQDDPEPGSHSCHRHQLLDAF